MRERRNSSKSDPPRRPHDKGGLVLFLFGLFVVYLYPLVHDLHIGMHFFERGRFPLVPEALPHQVRPLFFQPFSINRADSELLQTVPGIGPALAERIITFREEHGAISALEDLLDVPGIGQAKLSRIRERAVL